VLNTYRRLEKAVRKGIKPTEGSRESGTTVSSHPNSQVAGSEDEDRGGFRKELGRKTDGKWGRIPLWKIVNAEDRPVSPGDLGI